jgi:hypothetical protein
VKVDITTLAAFMTFFALVLAWLAAPTDVKRPVVAVEPSPIGAD